MDGTLLARMRRAAQTLSTCAIALLVATSVYAQQPEAGGASSSNLVLPSTRDEGIGSVNGPGIQGRAGFYAFETFGREESMTAVELFPYVMDGNFMLFGDGRLFVDLQGQFGGNVGLGARFRESRVSRVYGASLWYDADNRLDTLFHGLGLSLETYGDLVDGRLNLYTPVGDTEKLVTERLINPRFVGNTVVYDQLREIGKALAGVDYEIGFLLPTDRLRQHNLKWFVGGYHFAGNNAKGINGFKTRLQGAVIPSIDTQLELTTDNTFGTNLMLGVTWSYFGKFERKETSRGLRYDRMGEFPRRNYNIIVAVNNEITPDFIPLNPLTNLPFVVQQVGPGGNSSGTPDDPWGTIADAQAAGGDIIFVQAGTVLTEQIQLQPGQMLFGEAEGMDHFIDVAGFGKVLLPGADPGDSTPIIQGVTGDAVTLASDTTFAGFIIDSATGNAIAGNGVSNVLIQDVQILTPGADGLHLVGSSGDITLDSVSIDGALGSAVSVSGGDAEIVFAGDINNSSGRAIVVEQTTGGAVDLSDANIIDNGGDGVFVDSVDGNVIFEDLTVVNTTGVGIEITGSGDGFVAFRGTTTVNNAGNAGIFIHDRDQNTLFDQVVVDGGSGQIGIKILDTTSLTHFNGLDIETTNAAALFAMNAGTLQIADGVIASVGGAAVDVEETDLNVNLTSISSDGASYGLRLVDTPGAFRLLGDNDFASGGLITGAGTAVVLEGVGEVALAAIDIEDSGVGISAENVDILSLGAVRLSGHSGTAIDLLNVAQFSMYNSLIADSGAPGDPSIRYRVDEDGDYQATINQSTVTTDTGTAVEVEALAGGEGASLFLHIQSTALVTNADNAGAVDVLWKGTLLANVVGSGLAATGDNGFGARFHAAATGELAQISITSNAIGIDGDHGTAVDLVTAGPSELIVGGNQIGFQGADGVGLAFNLAESSAVWISSNTIVDAESGATGMLFHSVAGPGEVRIENNVIDLQGPGGILDEGIIFESITGTITLQGDADNVIQGATNPFYVPAGKTTGSILINGTPVP